MNAGLTQCWRQTVPRPGGTSWRWTTCFGVFCVKIRRGPLAVTSCKYPPPLQKTKKLTLFGAQSRVCAETKRLSGSWRTFAQLFERGSRRNHLCQFLWLSLTGFWRGRGGGQILGFSTDLRPRPSYCCTMKWMWRVTWQWKLKKSCRVTKNPHFSAEIQKPRRDQKNADLVGKTKSW